MLRIRFLLGACALTGLLLPSSALGHGGSFRGPSGGVPPGLRSPTDPQPPPPSPGDPSGGGTLTPPDPGGSGAVTPRGANGGSTPDGGGVPSPLQPSGNGGRSRPTTSSLTYASWQFWWAYNNDDILELKGHALALRPSSSTPVPYGTGDAQNRKNAQRPTQALVLSLVVPALKHVLATPGENDDVCGGAVVALGKIGGDRLVSTFADILHRRYRTPKGTSIDFQNQTRESAVLALGLLPELDAQGRAAVRSICLRAIANTKLRWRERAWAAVCLGLQRDKEALRPLWRELESVLHAHVTKEDLPAAILAGVGLIGETGFVDEKGREVNVASDLAEAFRTGRLFGVDLSAPVRSFVGYALLKIGEPNPDPQHPGFALKTVLQVLGSRTHRIVRRTAAIAAGVLGSRADAAGKERAVRALVSYLRKGSLGDESGQDFALIALSRIGTPRAIDALLDATEGGRVNRRTYAAVGLGTYVFYRDQNARKHDAEALEPDLRKRILKKLRRGTEHFRDADSRAAFYLARGLAQDVDALPDLVELAASRHGSPMVRAFACQALGLLGKATPDVKDALRTALVDSNDPELRSGAAIGLSLLHDASVLDLLLKQLKKARSFAVQGQLIRAIGAIGDQNALRPLLEILRDKDQPTQTRAMAVVGLGMVGDLRTIPTLSRLSKDYNWRASLPDLDELLTIL